MSFSIAFGESVYLDNRFAMYRLHEEARIQVRESAQVNADALTRDVISGFPAAKRTAS